MGGAQLSAKPMSPRLTTVGLAPMNQAGSAAPGDGRPAEGVQQRRPKQSVAAQGSVLRLQTKRGGLRPRLSCDGRRPEYAGSPGYGSEGDIAGILAPLSSSPSLSPLLPSCSLSAPPLLLPYSATLSHRSHPSPRRRNPPARPRARPPARPHTATPLSAGQGARPPPPRALLVHRRGYTRRAYPMRRVSNALASSPDFKPMR